ncbi:Di-sulfide bridge nucleocytoplasmic transport domain-containing protein [Pyronema domesticum]|uniref:Similar to Nucleus export protein brr6 acc. no. Q9UT30 n=1 Tax=Pyronema omphalodes (strain CBS 100304) TaxID=1076935 RepID=U4LCT8_PYROM|nr:Di-sulfide bridge nucleocytoplasmic transport domain-containing protein [Pyronema domesticum]CCX08306.1 Similar to Nucleus export protein brr6; acc. no. Q9UT30 [Pyronema omphalodes CBS 100304]
MEHNRGNESPMDWQWENISGRIDPNSPFNRSVSAPSTVDETPVKKGQSFLPSTGSPLKQPVFSTPAPFPQSPIKPPNFAAIKPIFQTPSATPFRRSTFQTPAFQTPRRAFDSPSKDSDIFSTPGDDDTEVEAATPDAVVAQLFRSGKKGGISSLSLSSTRVTGRGELRRGKDREGAISKPVLRKRRNRSVHHDNRSEYYSSDEEREHRGRSRSPSKRKQQKAATTDEWLYTHRNIPAIVSGYLNLAVQAAWVGLVVYILFAAFRIVRDDMDHRVAEAATEVLGQIAGCHKNYLQNRCAPDFRVPAMELSCQEWERCMNQDPTKVGRAKVSARTIAEILNGFVNELHWKTLGLIAFLVTICWLAGNLVGRNSNPVPPPQMYPPSTPHHAPPTPYAATPYSAAPYMGTPYAATPSMFASPFPHMPSTPHGMHGFRQQMFATPVGKRGRWLPDTPDTPLTERTERSIEWEEGESDMKD